MPIIGDSFAARQALSDDPTGIAGTLEAVLTGVGRVMQGNKDKAYRSAAAKILNVPESELGYFKREELKDLVKEKMKSSYGEYKPKTREEALEFERAKAGYKNDIPTKEYKSKEAEIGLKILNGEKITPQERDFYISAGSGRYVPSSAVISDVAPVDSSLPGSGKGSGMGDILKAILMNTHPVSALINSIRQRPGQAPQAGAVTQPVPTSVPGAQPQAAAPVSDPIAVRIQEALSQGMDPMEIARMLQEKGIDPKTYGL